MNLKQKGFVSVPMAIIVAGIIVAAAVIYSSGGGQRKPSNDDGTTAKGAAASSMRPIDAKDHIRGNYKAKIKLIEYSDTECPFCKKFHVTMQKIMDYYGPSGDVAWVYRHFPLDSLHSKARNEAEATECAAELGGNDTFWAYIDRLFEITPSNDGLDPIKLLDIAEYVNLPRAEFDKCLKSGRHAARVQSDYDDAVAAGGRGTPYTVVLSSDGQKSFISGAQTYSAVKQVIDALLSR